MNLKVLTYNVFGMPWGNKNIESLLLWCLYKTDAEILCFQEVFSKEHRRVIEEFCQREGSQWNCWFPTTPSTFLSQWFSLFECISGLCVLTKKSIEILEEPVFVPFKVSASVDRFVKKGFFHLICKKDGDLFHLITTHFQSDFTECGCRIRYPSERILQEIELFAYTKHLPQLIVLGDFNSSRFYHFHFVNSPRQRTFRETGESLDHCLVLRDSKILCEQAKYFHQVTLSDHTPVLFHLRFTQS